MYLFLDTEWADAAGDQLVSLALISDDTQHEFYAERGTLPAAPTPFAQTVVYPLLERGERALSDANFTAELRCFLEPRSDAFVLFDHHNDGRLLKLALNGFVDVPAGSALARPFGLGMTQMIRDGAFRQYFEDWFASDPALAVSRHHALFDARALRAAWLRVTARPDCVPWPGA